MAPQPVVIAVIESGGFNVLHQDFRATSPVTQPPGMPVAQRVSLPASGTFGERVEALEAGPLGNLEEGGLYAVEGTRVIGIYVPQGETQKSILDDRGHGTGSASSAVGVEHGTAPDALLVYVPETNAAAWRWVAEQPPQAAPQRWSRTRANCWARPEVPPTGNSHGDVGRCRTGR